LNQGQGWAGFRGGGDFYFTLMNLMLIDIFMFDVTLSCSCKNLHFSMFRQSFITQLFPLDLMPCFGARHFCAHHMQSTLGALSDAAHVVHIVSCERFIYNR
jgi:hypothetical protein